MSGYRIASRYAKSLLDLAEEQKILDKVQKDMTQLHAAISESRPLYLMLKSPIIPHLRKSEILSAAFKGKFQKLTLGMIDLITKKGREGFLGDIAAAFIAYYNDRKGIQHASVITTYAIDKKTKKSFEELVTKYTGKQPVLAEEVDPSILGGFILRMGDQQIDQSVTSALKDIELNFKK